MKFQFIIYIYFIQSCNIQYTYITLYIQYCIVCLKVTERADPHCCYQNKREKEGSGETLSGDG